MTRNPWPPYILAGGWTITVDRECARGGSELSACVCSALLQAAQVVSTEQPDKKKGGKGKGKGASSGKVSPHHHHRHHQLLSSSIS